LYTLKAATENIASGILIKRINKLMRSITRGSNEKWMGTPTSIRKALTRIDNGDSENVPEDN
jgi:hypothetical protein